MTPLRLTNFLIPETAAHLATDAVVGPLTWKKLVEQDF